MSEETETITVADVSAGVGGGDADPGTTVDLPVVDVLTGRAFITGKSGSGKSNTASVVVERLLSGGYPVLIVDSDGEYYGLKEEFELLHAGADEECDIQVEPEHAEKLASLALEENVPIVLDVSGYLDDGVRSELVLEVARHLFAKEKKLKKPFLLLIEECHEYIPEGGGLDRTGEMLVKVGKRGRKHGLGVAGISQRPADVKKDFITQCDWLVWHRLTWENDTKVVGRILGSEYADAVEDLGDGEAFLMADSADSVRRVQFRRKQTFDAGATPGLEDFERPDLKSVSGDLVDELRSITDERERRESELADLRQELDRKRQRIAELERDLEEARDLSRMADDFAQAMLRKADASYRGGSGADEAAAESDGGVRSEPPGERTQRDLRDYERSAPASAPAPDADPRSDPDPDPDPDPDRVVTGGTDPAPLHADERDAVVEALRERVRALDPDARRMLAHYRAERLSTPERAHEAATSEPGEGTGTGGGSGAETGRDDGSGDATAVYALHRPLRRQGFVGHVAAGRYAYALPALVRGLAGDEFTEEELTAAVDAVEATF
jgi:hypothetical protein